jgi:hypothetical protein
VKAHIPEAARSTRSFLAIAPIVVCAGLIIGLLLPPSVRGDTSTDPNLMTFDNQFGQARTFNERGVLNPDNPFFSSLGTNGRACVTCHQAEDGWTITPSSVQRRFTASDGLDPIFRTNDGSNCQGADVSTRTARQTAFSLLLTRGLIRVSVDLPFDAEFVIESVDDPYDCPSVILSSPSMYRRPLPSTNLRFLSAVMWDGRESPAGRSINDSLLNQAKDATLGHAQASLVPTDAELRAIVEFETGLYTAQASGRSSGSLSTQGATGGPQTLARQPFFIGINDPLGQNPTGAQFDQRAFTVFAPWGSLTSSAADPTTGSRRAIARGEELFNAKPLTITGVNGLNDDLHTPSIAGTCTTCHDSPNVGNHSVKAPLNLGLTDSERRTADMPLYTLRNLRTGETRQTTDPGRAMVTGKWKDIGRFKGPILRGLAARAPYFHNGFAATLADVVEFYDSRFQIGLTPVEKQDLIAFLAAL